MCIRDRENPIQVTTGKVVSQEIPAFIQTTGSLIADETSDAVSYTHLRAHETVLDLVCRLLLEKKKN